MSQNAVSKNATQFKGNAQHDAQEFLLWLLDRVHEDINTVNPNSRPPIKVNLEDLWMSLQTQFVVLLKNTECPPLQT